LEKKIIAATEEDAPALITEIEGIEIEIKSDDAEMKEAEAATTNAKKEEKEAEVATTNAKKEEKDANADDGSKEEKGDEPKNPIRPTIEKSDHSSHITALLTRMRLKDSLDLVNLSNRVGLRDTEAVVGYKSSGMFGKTGIVCDTEIEAWPIYRIKKSVLVDEESVPNIVED
jgi:hypothetical protein